MSRRALFLALLVAGATGEGAAQGGATLSAVDSLLAQQFEVDFAIPDAPAFALLSATPTTIVRPTSVRALTAAFSGFTDDDALLQLPRAFAVEFSPLLLARGNRLGLAEYARNAPLYRTRVSLATQRSGTTGSATELALGVRVTLHDAADLRMNPGYVRSATAAAAAINDVYLAARMRAGPPPAPIVLTDAERDSINTLMKPVEARWADSVWNAGALDLAFGALAAARDSLGDDPRIRSYAAWGTWALGFGDWGQLLLGGRGEIARDSVGGGDLAPGGSLAARLYVGTNAYKFFVETQGSGRRASAPEWLLHGGGEVRVRPSFWADLSTGVTWDAGTPRLVTRFGLRAAAPVGS